MLDGVVALSSRNGELHAHTLIELVDGRDLAIWAQGSMAHTLTDAELVSVLLSTGHDGANAVVVAQRVLERTRRHER